MPEAVPIWPAGTWVYRAVWFALTPVPSVTPKTSVMITIHTTGVLIRSSSTPRKDRLVGTWATANNVEIAYTPTNSSWLNRIEAQFTALRYFTLDGTDHASHKEQASMIRRYIIWRNNHAYDERLRRIVAKANVA